MAPRTRFRHLEEFPTKEQLLQVSAIKNTPQLERYVRLLSSTVPMQYNQWYAQYGDADFWSNVDAWKHGGFHWYRNEMLHLRRPEYFKLSDKIECEIWLARDAGKGPVMMSVQGGCWLWRRIFDIIKESAGITSLRGLPMAGNLHGTQPDTCRTSSVSITEGPRAGEWFDMIDHPVP